MVIKARFPMIDCYDFEEHQINQIEKRILDGIRGEGIECENVIFQLANCPGIVMSVCDYGIKKSERSRMAGIISRVSLKQLEVTVIVEWE